MGAWVVFCEWKMNLVLIFWWSLDFVILHVRNNPAYLDLCIGAHFAISLIFYCGRIKGSQNNSQICPKAHPGFWHPDLFHLPAVSMNFYLIPYLLFLLHFAYLYTSLPLPHPSSVTDSLLLSRWTVRWWRVTSDSQWTLTVFLSLDLQ